MADIKGNDNIAEFSSDNAELVSITINNNGKRLVFGQGATGGSGFVTKTKTITANGTYSADDDNTEVLYLEKAKATFSSFTEPPRVVEF